MTQREINISFDYVVKCIDSCFHESHLESAEKMIENFNNKYGVDILHTYLVERLKMKAESFKPIINCIVHNPIENY